jgi:oligoendopeptidase F
VVVAPYREHRENFVANYLALLEAGGSDSPEALLRPLGLNIHDPDFWQKGFQEIGGLIKSFEGLIPKIWQTGMSADQMQ